MTTETQSNAVYLEDPTHSRWVYHYVEAAVGPKARLRYGRPHLLAFTGEWAERHLPPDGSNDALRCELVDTQTNETYEWPIYAAYEAHEQLSGEILDIDGQPAAGFVTLQAYFYAEHHCPCHRETDASNAGWPGPESEECGGNRFHIRRIYAPSLPDLTLYSETIGDNLLEHELVSTAYRLVLGPPLYPVKF